MDVNQIRKENKTIKIELKYRPCSMKHEIKNQTRFLFKIDRKIFDSDQMKLYLELTLVVILGAAMRNIS